MWPGGMRLRSRRALLSLGWYVSKWPDAWTLDKTDCVLKLCFYPSAVDMWVDGKKAEKAITPSLGK